MDNIEKKKLRTGIIIGAIVSVITLFALMIIFTILVFFGGPPYVTEDSKDYDIAMHKYDNIQCGFLTFPETIVPEADVKEFYFSYQDTWDDPTCEVFLQCAYTEDMYAKEIARLEGIERIYGEDVQKLLKKEAGRYPYPVYIAMENHNHGYEYALLTGENEITYVYTAFKERHNIHFGEKYLPSDFGELYYEGIPLDEWQNKNFNNPKVDIGPVSASVVMNGYSIYLDTEKSGSDGWVHQYK